MKTDRVRTMFAIDGTTIRTCALIALVGVGNVSCGLPESGNGPTSASLRSRVEIVSESDLQTAVQVDSIAWAPSFFPVEFGGGQEVSGSFTIRFTNVTNSRLEIRYELRFLDRDDFTIDVFNPFGQPIRLGPGGVDEVSGEFRIRIRHSSDIELLRTLLVVVHITRPA